MLQYSATMFVVALLLGSLSVSYLYPTFGMIFGGILLGAGIVGMIDIAIGHRFERDGG